MRGHGPQDVTSTWTGHEGINLPQEVGPQAVRKISSQLPTEGYRRNEIDGRNEHTGGTARCQHRHGDGEPGAAARWTARRRCGRGFGGGPGAGTAPVRVGRGAGAGAAARAGIGVSAAAVSAPALCGVGIGTAPGGSGAAEVTAPGRRRHGAGIGDGCGARRRCAVDPDRE
jgi:hypothetical protein